MLPLRLVAPLALALAAAAAPAAAQRVTKQIPPAPPPAAPAPAAAAEGQACRWQPRQGSTDARSAAAAPVALKEVFGGAFLVGAALNPDVFFERDPGAVALVRRHFDVISPEDVLKWECVHPRPGVYDFAAADRYVEFGQRHGIAVIGHTLVWHSQVPRWVFQDAEGRPAGRDTVLARMREHIQQVAGRYKGRIKGWDVVNEALNEDGTLRDSPWRRAVGDDYIVKAFQYAREADPQAELYYNDYSLANPAKRDGAARLVRELQAAGVPVAGVGSQDHHQLGWPSAAAVDSMIRVFAATGVKVNITELDVDVLPRAVRSTGADVSTRAALRAEQNPYTAGLPDSVQRALARRYAELFAVYLRHRDVVDRVTFWGVRDGDSWLNDWPVRGRTSHPLLFDRRGLPKPAFAAVVDAARAGATGGGAATP